MFQPTSPVAPGDARRRRAGALALGMLAAAGIVPAGTAAQGLAVAPPALGMALAPPGPGMAGGGGPQPAPAAKPPPPGEEHPAEGEPGRRRPPLSGSGLGTADGRLPNQKTGRRHEHVVRDICIGC